MDKSEAEILPGLGARCTWINLLQLFDEIERIRPMEELPTMRIAKSLVIVLALLSFTGCPIGPNFALGVWLFSLPPLTPYVGAAFLPNGEMDEFDPMTRPTGADGNFSGVLTWQRTGRTITMLQAHMNGNSRIFEGTLESSTYMTGTWTSINDPAQTGPFTASKAPSN